eukprot:g1229.t1
MSSTSAKPAELLEFCNLCKKNVQLHPGSKIRRKNHVRTKRHKANAKYYSENNNFNLIGCRYCGFDDDDGKQLVCDICDSQYHIYCLTPPLKNIPQGDWACPICVKFAMQHPTHDVAIAVKNLNIVGAHVTISNDTNGKQDSRVNDSIVGNNTTSNLNINNDKDDPQEEITVCSSSGIMVPLTTDNDSTTSTCKSRRSKRTIQAPQKFHDIEYMPKILQTKLNSDKTNVGKNEKEIEGTKCKVTTNTGTVEKEAQGSETGKEKTKIVKSYYCDVCDYRTAVKRNMLLHRGSNRHKKRAAASKNIDTEPATNTKKKSMESPGSTIEEAMATMLKKNKRYILDNMIAKTVTAITKEVTEQTKFIPPFKNSKKLPRPKKGGCYKCCKDVNHNQMLLCDGCDTGPSQAPTNWRMMNKMNLVVGVCANHVGLTQEDVGILMRYELKPKAFLSSMPPCHPGRKLKYIMY